MISLGADPLVPPLAIGLFAVVYIALTVVLYRRFRPILARGYWWLLLSLKLVALVLCLAVLANPCFVRQRPDPGAFQVAVLIDATGSMQARDIDGHQRRLDVVKERLVGDAPFASRLRQRYPNTSWFLFAGDDLRRIDGTSSFDVLPGDTDIDDALQRVLSGNAGQVKLGAVLLLSDGLDNVAGSLVEAGPAFKAAGVPVHTIGIGDTRARHDLGVRWIDLPRQPTKGKPFKITAELTRNFPGDDRYEVQFFDGSRLLQTLPVSFTGDELRRRVEFDHVSYVAGFRTCRVRVAALPDEENTLNNVDFAALDVAEPDVFNVLYYSDSLDWEYKFLNQLAEHHERLHLDAIIRLGETTWFSRGFGDSTDPVKGFPELDAINRYDALIVSLRSLQQLDEPARAALLSFTERRGGGLILTGAADKVPIELQGLMPVAALPGELGVARARESVVFRPSLLMNAWSRQEAGDLAARLYLPASSPFYRLGAQDLKPGAIPIVTAGEAQWVLLAAQQYGSGKVALQNVGTTWHWPMHDDLGFESYGMFWSRLISWASSTLQQRLTVKPAGAKLELGSEQTISIDLLDATYQPDNAASIGAVFTTLSGQQEQLGFIQDPRIDGRYVAKFVPREPGEFSLVLKALLHDGDLLEERFDYVVVDRSREVEPAPLAEERLRSLARITGGQYWHYREIDAIDELPITRQIQFLEDRHYWLGSWAFLLAAILALLPDWIARRRIGLR